MNEYESFLESKRVTVHDAGFDATVPDFLYDFQVKCVEWALSKGRAALFEDCGLGKTPQQLVWADEVSQHTKRPVMIFAPLAVSEQTVREGEKFNIPVTACRSMSDVRDGVNITNYEMLEHFTPNFGGLVLDESSILKNYSGKFRQAITEFGHQIHYRLACTATPAPNDLVEIINHSDFLSVLRGKEVIALFFRQDGNTTHAWRIKGHAERDFWSWMASWARALRTPADIGCQDDRFVLPSLTMTEHVVDGHIEDGFLFPVEAQTLQERNQARRESINERVELAASLVNNSTEPWVVWCGLNKESEALTKAIPDAIEVKGSDANEHKRNALLGFASGARRVIVTKPSIAGFGMNWQHCAKQVFVGLSDSFEQLYQAVRRCWRFGQSRPVTVHLVIANTEGAVLENIKRKELEAERMMSMLVAHMSEHYKHHKDDGRYTGTERLELPGFLKGTNHAERN